MAPGFDFSCVGDLSWIYPRLTYEDRNEKIAETDTDNQASHRVLEKCGMQKYEQANDSIWWKLKKNLF
ncbi:MAG: GNAT family N-acetyltransferase [Candidatus Symbiothrix sp.]|jgi:hypothetical protein|nr:GNAT family N-acetyltransferase [Candidatus Symbiothrix sp.]